MKPDQIEDVLNLSALIETYCYSDAANTPALIAALINWRDGSFGTVEPGTVKPEPEPEPPAPKAPSKPPTKAPAKKAPAKAAAKPEPTPDPSDDDADF